jgi:hypothetical protein
VQISSLEVADIFRAAGASYRAVQAGHLSLAQLKVMSAIETCRTAALGGHVEGCDDCGHLRIAYNSCRNRHCPKCQGAAARAWLAERESDLLPVGYFHVVFTLPGEIADIALQNKAVVYDLLFKAASETMMTIAADPKHLGARIGITAVLHTWGSAMTHHPHVHMIVPGGGISPDGMRWVGSRPGFLLPVRVLAKLFRRLFLTRLLELHAADKLIFFGQSKGLEERRAFVRHLAPLRHKKWHVYAKPPFAGPEAVLAYLSRYTHRVAISNRRLIAFDKGGVTFRYKDYRRSGAEPAGHDAPSARVHPPLPAACPAARLSPHSALWAARKRRSHTRASGRSASSGTCRTDRTGRSASALSLLRRPHAYHRDLRALEPTACAAASVHLNRDGTIVTRHGPNSSHAAAPSLRPTIRRAPIVHVRATAAQEPALSPRFNANSREYPAVHATPESIAPPKRLAS